jgi:predicted dienelactone hydrolase
LESLFFLAACGPKNPFPLSDPGPYQFGTHQYKFLDTNRMNKEIGLYVWYPAMLPKDAEPSRYNFDAEPDLSAAPYPVILSSAKSGLIFDPHLATYEFVVVGVDGQDSEDNWVNWLIDFPLDQISTLDQIASHQLDDLEGMIDSNRVGVLGYSLDSYNALALCGACIDPDFYTRTNVLQR